MLHAWVVRHHHGAAGYITELADHGGVRTPNDAHNAPLGAPCTGLRAQPGDFHDHMIAVHGIFDLVAWDKNVAIDVRQRQVGHHEPISIRMVH